MIPNLFIIPIYTFLIILLIPTKKTVIMRRFMILACWANFIYFVILFCFYLYFLYDDTLIRGSFNMILFTFRFTYSVTRVTAGLFVLVAWGTLMNVAIWKDTKIYSLKFLFGIFSFLNLYTIFMACVESAWITFP